MSRPYDDRPRQLGRGSFLTGRACEPSPAECGVPVRSSASSLPIQIGNPPGSLLCAAGTPPDGYDYLGAVSTIRGWLYPCPCCCEGWVGLAPDGSRFGYGIAADVGCSCGCVGPEISWWQLWQLGHLPPRIVQAVTGRTKAYVKAVVRRMLVDLPQQPTLDELRQVAFQLGRWLEAGGLSAEAIAPSLLAACDRAQLARAELASKLAEAVSAGRADPARVPV
jgi:hypothetical protein